MKRELHRFNLPKCLIFLMTLACILFSPRYSIGDYGVLALKFSCQKNADKIELEPYIAWDQGNSKYIDFDADKAIARRSMKKGDVTYYSLDEKFGKTLDYRCKTKNREVRFSIKDGAITVVEDGKEIVDWVHIGSIDDYIGHKSKFNYSIESKKWGEWEECYSYSQKGTAQCDKISGHSNSYMIVGGRNKEVCREYGKNLNSFKDLTYPMVCERIYNPKFTKFKKPEWKKLDVWENKELVRHMDRYLWNSGIEKEKEFDKNIDKWLGRLKKRIEENRISLSLTRIDIDNNGKLNNVIQYDMGECSNTDENSFSSPNGRVFIIFNEDMTKIDKDLSKFTRALRLDMFIYKGRTYLDYFGGDLKFKNGGLAVYDSVLHSGGWAELGATICTYKYKDKIK